MINEEQTYLVALTESELYEIRRKRQHAAQMKELRDQQSKCEHQWRYDGHSHNDDCYICTICGLTDYR